MRAVFKVDCDSVLFYFISMFSYITFQIYIPYDKNPTLFASHIFDPKMLSSSLNIMFEVCVSPVCISGSSLLIYFSMPYAYINKTFTHYTKISSGGNWFDFWVKETNTFLLDPVSIFRPRIRRNFIHTALFPIRI